MAQSNAPTEDVKDLLVNAGIGTFGGEADWSIYIGSEPNKPNNIITLYDTPGIASNPKFRLDEPRFQVRVRSKNYNIGFQKAIEVSAQLQGLPSQTFNGTRYEGIWVVLETNFLKADGEGRSIFVTTYRMIREPNEITGDHRVPL